MSFLQNSRSVYRNVLCHSLKMRPDRNQPRNQPDQVQSRQEAEVPQQNRRIHRQTGTMSLSKPSLNPKPNLRKPNWRDLLLFRTSSTLWKQPLETARKWWHLSQTQNANYYSLWFHWENSSASITGIIKAFFLMTA